MDIAIFVFVYCSSGG